MNFDTILDQPTAVRALKSAMQKNRVAHAYMFVGPAGVGRKLTARIFAQSLNCETLPHGNPCGKCSSCQLIKDGRHPDVQTIMPTKRSATITVEQIEDLLPFAYMRPIKGKTKVFILSDADRLGVGPANKLLKTLEEPPPSTVFVLVTEKPENILPTVASRCQQIKFGRLHAESVREILISDFNVDEERAALAAELADGQVTRGLQFADPRRTETIVGIVDSLEGCGERLKGCDSLLEFFAEERAALHEQAEREISGGAEDLTPAAKASLEDLRKSFVSSQYSEFLNDCLGLLLTYYRDMLVLKETKKETFVVNRNKIDVLRDRAKHMSREAITENMKDIEEASEYCAHFVGEDRIFLDLLLRLRNA